MTTDVGRDPSGQALAVPAKPASGLVASRFDPSRIRALANKVRDSQIALPSSQVAVSPEALADLLMAAHDWAEVAERVADVDYWEGSGNDLIDWVALGYVERGDGRKTLNPRFSPLSAIAIETEGQDREAGLGAKHESAGRRHRPEPSDIAQKEEQ